MSIIAILFNAGARLVGSPRRIMSCPKCHRPHIDLNEWARRPHRTHLCAICGNKWAHDNVLKTIGI